MDVVSRKIIVRRNATIRDTFSVRVNKLRGNREVFTWILAVPGLIRAISPDGGIQVCVCVCITCTCDYRNFSKQSGVFEWYP